jgi:YHS domain-containing protein
VIGGSADVIPQPSAKVGQKTYCLVSGVVIQIGEATVRREVDGKTFYFCCEACAGYFDANRQRVAKLRSVALR